MAEIEKINLDGTEYDVHDAKPHGTLTAPLVVTGGDGSNGDVGKIVLDQTQSGQITNNSTSTIFGFLNNNDNFVVGSTSYTLRLRGSGTRPKFNGNDVALYSDVPTLSYDTVPTTDSNNLIKSKDLKTLFDAKQNTISNPLTLSDKSGFNCNTLYDGKIWLVGSGSNCPSGSQYGALFVLPYRQASGNTIPDFGAQIFLPNGDDSTKPNSMFYRTSLKNTWNAWQEVAVEGKCNADKVDGYHVSVVSELPASPDSNTVYIIV